MSTSQYANITLPLLILLVPMHVPTLIFFYHHRHSQVFKSGCSLELTYALILGCWFVSAWKLATSYDQSISCVLGSAISSISYFIVIVAYLQRALKLLFRFEIQSALDAFRALPREEQTIKALETGQGGWYFRHRNLVRNKYSFLYFFLAFIIFCVINFIIALFLETNCEGLNTLDYLNWVFDVLVMPFAITIACKLRKHPNDAFSIKRDLGWAGIISILIIIVFVFGHQIFPTKTVDETSFVNAIFGCIAMLWLMMLSGYKQMYSLYLIDKHTEIPDYTTLENVLKVPSGYISYLNYLKTEFSGENLLFWQAVQEFRTNHLQNLEFTAAFRDAEQIFANYIRFGSPMELNIDNFLRENLLSTFAGYKARLDAGGAVAVTVEGEGGEVTENDASIVTMFDHTQTVVFDLMRKDPFRRYLSSPLYEEFKAAEDAKREVSSSSSSLKVVVSTVTKKLSLLAQPKRDLNQLSKSDHSHSGGSRGGSAAVEPESHFSTVEADNTNRPSPDKESRGFSFANEHKKQLEMISTNSSFVSPFGPPSPSRTSYVSPFGASGGGGLRTTIAPLESAPSDSFVVVQEPELSPRVESASTVSQADSSIGGDSSAAASTPVSIPRSVSYVSPF